jgi:hypothetical protein
MGRISDWSTGRHHGASNKHTHLVVSSARSAEGSSRRPKTSGQPPLAMTVVSDREVSRVLCCLVSLSKRPAWTSGETWADFNGARLARFVNPSR